VDRAERCAECDQATGRAGASDDSLYCDQCEAGPLCQECYDSHKCESTRRYVAKLETALETEGERADNAEQDAERYRVAIMRYCNYECEEGKSTCDKPSCALNVLEKR